MDDALDEILIALRSMALGMIVDTYTDAQELRRYLDPASPVLGVVRGQALARLREEQEEEADEETAEATVH